MSYELISLIKTKLALIYISDKIKEFYFDSLREHKNGCEVLFIFSLPPYPILMFREIGSSEIVLKHNRYPIAIQPKIPV